MNWVDVLVIVLALIAGISGARQGMVTALASLSGVLLGAIVGVQIAPSLVERFPSTTTRVAFTVAILVLLVALGETLGVWAGRAVRQRMHVEPVRRVDSALGTVVLALAVLVVAWLVAVPLTSPSSAATPSRRSPSVDRPWPPPASTSRCTTRSHGPASHSPSTGPAGGS